MSQVRDTIQHVTIVGVGTQGSMIAFRNAVYGKEVTGYSRTRTSIDKCRSKIRKWLNYYVETGRLSQAEADAAEQRISYAESLEDACKNAQLVVENVPEKLEVKQEIFRKLDSLCPPDALLNSNTSSLLMSDICAFVSPERKALTFSVDHDDPIRNDYLEMMWNPSTSEVTKQAALSHYRTLGFEPIITEREIKGYSINKRVSVPMGRGIYHPLRIRPRLDDGMAYKHRPLPAYGFDWPGYCLCNRKFLLQRKPG